MLNIKTIPVGILQVNCYIVWPEGGTQALIIDPGAEADKVVDVLDELGLEPCGILLTHAHVDHICGVSDLAARYGVGVWCHPGDAGLYASPDNAIPPWIPAAEDLPELLENVPELPGATYEVIHTPGHTPGGVCYYFASEGELFSGDTLFRGTYGRTDFPGGDYDTLVHSIVDVLFALPESVKVHPGHHASTTIGVEKRTQSF